MSKAFTRESDDDDELQSSALSPALLALPPGVKNYLTSDGARCMRDELGKLLEAQQAASPGGASGTGAADQDVLTHRRIAYLRHCLDTAVVVEPPAEPDRVAFGTTVKVQDPAGRQTQYRIVGIAEVDLDRNWVSWISPLARALVGKRCGDKVRVSIPEGPQELKIIAIERS